MLMAAAGMWAVSLQPFPRDDYVGACGQRYSLCRVMTMSTRVVSVSSAATAACCSGRACQVKGVMASRLAASAPHTWRMEVGRGSSRVNVS